jgi:hypothetical protein
MSGLMNAPAGPRDENAAMTSNWPAALVPAVNVAVSGPTAAAYARKSVPSARWTVGNQWLSVPTSASSGLYRIMPTAPPASTL